MKLRASFQGFRAASILSLISVLSASTLAREESRKLELPVPNAVSTATLVGAPSPDQLLHLNLALLPGRPSALQAYADAVSSPKNPSFRKFLTPAQVGSAFGQPLAQVQQVVDYLQSNGIQVKRIAANRLNIQFDATVAQAETAFQTKILNYRSNDRNDAAHPLFFSYSVVPSLPNQLASKIVTIAGLENHIRPVAAFRKRKQSVSNPLTPSQIGVLYDLAPMTSNGFNGQSRTIAISSFDGFSLNNVPTFYTDFGLVPPSGGAGSNIKVESVDGGSMTGPSSGEADLDIQTVLSQAPLSNLMVYDGVASEPGYFDTLTQEVDENTADIIVEPYGWPLGAAANYTAAHNLHLSMTAQGITYITAAGDGGTNQQTNDYPICDPEVTVLGGSVPSVSNTGARQSEVGWGGEVLNDGSTVSGGGGWMTNSIGFNALPSWQTGTGVPTGINFRLFPDLSMLASGSSVSYQYDNGAFQFVFNGALMSVDGTSVSSTLFAGSIGVVEQALIAANVLPANSAGKQRLGRINDFLYSLNGGKSAVFDITQGSNGNLPNGTTAQAGTGWDFVTGWGAPDFNNLEHALYPSSLSSLSLSPSTVQEGLTSTGTVTLTAPAPPGGEMVSLTSKVSAYVKVPTSITIPGGQLSGTFSITTGAYSSSYSSLITASANGSSVSATLSVLADSVSGLSLNPVTVFGGTGSTGTVTLTSPAPSGGWVVKLASQSPSYVGVPATVTVAAGSTSQSFNISTVLYTQSYTNLIKAYDVASAKTATLNVTGDAVTALSLNPSSVVGGQSSTGTVTILNPAPTGGYEVNLTTQSSYYVPVPATVTVAAGATTATFPVQTKFYSSTYTNVIQAADALSHQRATLTVIGDSIASLSLSPASVTAGQGSTGTVILNSAAPAGGWTVNLISQSPSYVGVPASITIPAGSTSGTFPITTKVFTSTYTNIIQAADAVSQQRATLTVVSDSISALTLNPSTVTGGGTSTGTITLSAPAPANGWTVQLVATHPTYVGVPSSVTIPAGSTTATFSVSTIAFTATYSSLITASDLSSHLSATLTVNP